MFFCPFMHLVLAARTSHVARSGLKSKHHSVSTWGGQDFQKAAESRQLSRFTRFLFHSLSFSLILSPSISFSFIPCHSLSFSPKPLNLDMRRDSDAFCFILYHSRSILPREFHRASDLQTHSRQRCCCCLYINHCHSHKLMDRKCLGEFFRNELRSFVGNELRTFVRNELRSFVRNELRSCGRNELRSCVWNELRSFVRNDLRHLSGMKSDHLSGMNSDHCQESSMSNCSVRSCLHGWPSIL
jgi:hypothetical protein